MKNIENNFGASIILGLWGFLLPIHALIITVLLFVLANLFTGVWRAIKEKKKLSSSGVHKTIEKLFIYVVIIVLFYLIDKFIIINQFEMLGEIFLARTISAIIIGSELMSIWENSEAILNKKFLPIIRRWFKIGKELSKEVKEIKDNIKE